MRIRDRDDARAAFLRVCRQLQGIARIAWQGDRNQRIRARLSMVFQQFNLWAHMTALENVMEAPMRVLA